MKTQFNSRINLRIVNRTVAESLKLLLKGRAEFDSMARDIENQLAPVYVYEVKCVGCGNRTEVASATNLSTTEIKKIEGWKLCKPCFESEDFK